MKNRLLSLALLAALAIPLHAHAELQGAPFIPEIDSRFDAVEDVLDNDAEGGEQLEKFARAVYDVSVDGGESVVHTLDATIPAGALITEVYVYIDTEFADSGNSSVRFSCTGSGDLVGFTNFDALSVNQVLAGGGALASPAGGVIIPSPAVAQLGYNSVPTACTIKAEVRSDAGYVPLSAGKSTILVKYLVH